MAVWEALSGVRQAHEYLRTENQQLLHVAEGALSEVSARVLLHGCCGVLPHGCCGVLPHGCCGVTAVVAGVSSAARH